MIKLILCAVAMRVCVDFKEEKYLFESFDRCGKTAVELVVRFENIYGYCCDAETCNLFEREENVRRHQLKDKLIDHKSSI